MPLISGTVPSLINGISQQPPTLRMPTQGETQVNGLSHISRGLEKRPCTEHVANVSGVQSTNSNDVFIHTIRRSEDEAYALVVKGGTSSNASVKLFDLTGFATGKAGTEVWIHSDKIPSSGSGTGYANNEVIGNGNIDTNANSYLSNFTASGTKVFEPNKLSATTIADFTFLLNKTQVVKKKNTTHTASNYQSMVYIRVGDFGADYKVKITGYDTAEMLDSDKKTNFGNSGVFEITLKTPDNKTESMSGTGTGAKSKSINNQNAVLVKNIAHALYTGNSAVGSSDTNLIKTKLVADNTFGGANDIGVDLKVNGTQKAIAGSTATRTSGDATISGIDTTNVHVGVPVTGTGVASGATVASVTTVGTSGSIEMSAVADATSSTNNLDIGYADNAIYDDTSGVIDKGIVSVNTTTATWGIKDLNAMSSGNPWTVTFNRGESIMTIENNEFPFLVEVTDGKGDTYMKAINGHDEVPKFSDLPATKVKKGFVAKISGDKGSGQDDYYVQYKDSVYKETFRPKYPLDTNPSARFELDNTTMPMQLYKAFGTTTYNNTTSSAGDGIYFILKPVDWSSRTVGDETTAPFPSFADYEETTGVDDALYTINDIFFHRNRLGFISDENVVLSEAAGYFNFFPNTVLSVLDTAPIDVAVSNNQVAILKSAIPFQENLLLFSDLQQFKLTSDQFLTPTSATVDVATNFETSTVAKPVPAGKTIFFPFQRGAFSGIREYMIDIASETNDANEITSHVPELLGGTVKKLAVSSNEELLCVLTDEDRSKVLVYKYFYDNQEKLQSSWSIWQYDADIIDISFLGSVAIILFRRDNNVILEKLNLSADNAEKIMDDKIGVNLDRRVRLSAHTFTTNTPTPSGAWEASKKYTNVTQTSTSGTGTGIKFDIETNSSGNPTFQLVDCGSGYAVSNTITFTDPGNTSNTAVMTISTLGTEMSVSESYTDINHDKVADTSGSNKIQIHDDSKRFGQKFKIRATAGILNEPRVNQTFTSTHDLTKTYTVVSSDTIEGTGSSATVEIEITPSVAEEAPIPDDTTFTFKEREIVYVTEQGQVIKSDAVTGVLTKGNQLSNSVNNSTPDVFAGIPYEFEYEFSEQFVKSGDDSINSGRLQMRNFEISYADTGSFDVEILPRPFDDRLRKINKRSFTGKVVGTTVLGRTQPETGVFRVPVYCSSKDVKIKVKSDSWLPVAIQSADWEAFQVLRNQRI